MNTEIRLFTKSSDNLSWQIYTIKILLGKCSNQIEIIVDKWKESGLYINDNLIFPISDIKTAFNIISLKKEIDSNRIDRHGRFDQSVSLHDHKIPIIDDMSNQIVSLIHSDLQNGAGDNNEFKVIFSHDIDIITGLEPRSIIKSITKNTLRLKKTPWIPLRKSFDKKCLLKNLRNILDIEDKYGIKGWYFMLADTYGITNRSSLYNIEWKIAKEFIGLIKEAGGMLGLHGSYSAREKDSYKVEAEKLRKISGEKVVIHRNHYLRFDPINIWSQLENAGFQVDSSIGYSNKIGFRAGTTRPYHPYNFKMKEQSRIQEIPLVFMDSAVSLKNSENAFHEVKETIGMVYRNKGCVALLFHPENFVKDDRLFDLFIKIIEYICVGKYKTRE